MTFHLIFLFHRTRAVVVVLLQLNVGAALPLLLVRGVRIVGVRSRLAGAAQDRILQHWHFLRRPRAVQTVEVGPVEGLFYLLSQIAAAFTGTLITLLTATALYFLRVRIRLLSVFLVGTLRVVI